MAVSVTEVGLGALAGSLSTLNPCVFPLLPLVLGGALQQNRFAPLALGLGMATTFAALGMFIGTLGAGLGLDTDTFRIFGGVMLILLAGVLLVPALNERFTLLMTPLSSGAQSVSSKLSGATLGSAFALGGVLGLVWSPCSGPLLISALTLVASEGGVVRGGVILGGFGLGAAIPLVAVAYASRAGFMKARGWLLEHIGGLKKGFAALLALMGVAILTGYDKVLEAALVSLLPDWWVQFTTKL
jgi:cytochrome c biogenesis protein CcdA